MREFSALEQISRPHGYDVCWDDFILRTSVIRSGLQVSLCDTGAGGLRFQRRAGTGKSGALVRKQVAELAEQPAGALAGDDVG